MSKPPRPDLPAAARPPARKPRKRQVALTSIQRDAGGEGVLQKHWRTYFLQALAETSNVTASAARAGISPSRAYKARRVDPEFAALWRGALIEGYQNLEMEVLGYLRDPHPDRKLDVAGAIRLLSLHRDEIARERALADRRDEREVLESIDAMIDEMRGRASANAALLAEDDRENADAGE